MLVDALSKLGVLFLLSLDSSCALKKPSVCFQYTDDVCFVLFALFNVGWATLYLEHWKRKGAVYAYRWGTLDKEDELLVEPRPLFHVRIIQLNYIDILIINI
jgi:hypothetical protein